MGDNYLFSTDFTLPLDEHDAFTLEYAGRSEMAAYGMWETATLPKTGTLKEDEEGVNTMSVAKMSSDKVEVTRPGHKVVEPPDTKKLSDKIKDPDSGLGLPGHGIDTIHSQGRLVTSLSIPIHQLLGSNSTMKPPSSLSPSPSPSLSPTRRTSSGKSEGAQTQTKKKKLDSEPSGKPKNKKFKSKFLLL